MSELEYERKQNRNFITKYLHSFRYKELLKFANENFKNRTVRILDIGCGPGGAYEALRHFDIEYTGVDIREDFIKAAQERYDDENCNFLVADATEDSFDCDKYDVVIALETFEHIPESRLVRLVEKLGSSNLEFLLCSVPIELGPAVIIKNFGSALMGYKRGQGDFIQTLYAGTYQLNKLPPHNVEHLGFNWYWLEQTLRHNLKVMNSTALPYNFIPKWIAPTVMFKCKKYLD